jgi:cell division protein FtsA
MAKSITLTALDIGTYSIKGLCARKDLRTGEIEILAKAQFPCFGVRNGEVVKPEQVSGTVAKVKEELSQKAGIKIKEVLVNIGGSHLFSVPAQGVVSVSRADQKISREDIERVLRQAQAINLPSNKEVLDILPREFVIDGEGGIKDPLGLEGIRLEAKVLLICLFSPILDNLEKAVSEADLQISDVIPSPLASSAACLTPQQKELGVLLVDIGSGTTSISVFEKGDLIDFAIFPIGSANITNDIAIGLRTEIKTAERIKKEFGTLKSEAKKGRREKIKIPEKSLVFSRKYLKDIVEARVSEIFSEIQKILKKIPQRETLPAGVVLTGGGALLPGIVEFAKQKLKLPSRLGFPRDIAGLEDPQFSTCWGLLLLGFESEGEEKGKRFKRGLGEKLKRIFKIFLP